jgi:hypothetical protein
VRKAASCSLAPVLCFCTNKKNLERKTYLERAVGWAHCSYVHRGTWTRASFPLDGRAFAVDPALFTQSEHVVFKRHAMIAGTLDRQGRFWDMALDGMSVAFSLRHLNLSVEADAPRSSLVGIRSPLSALA